MTSALFTNTSFLSLTQSEYFRKVTISGSPDNRMTASNTMPAVRLFIFQTTKADAERLLAFTVRGRFYPAIIQRISALNYHWQPLHFLKSRCWSLPFLSSGRCLSRTRNLRKVLSTGIQSTSTAFSLKPSIRNSTPHRWSSAIFCTCWPWISLLTLGWSLRWHRKILPIFSAWAGFK